MLLRKSSSSSDALAADDTQKDPDFHDLPRNFLKWKDYISDAVSQVKIMIIDRVVADPVLD